MSLQNTAQMPGLIGRLREAKGAFVKNQSLRQWLKAQSRNGCRIDREIALTGQPSRFDLIDAGARCIIERDVTIWLSPDEGGDPRLVIGEDAFIGRNTYLGVYQPVTIGRLAQVGAYCYIISASHRFDRRDIPIRMQGFTGAPVAIEEDAWLG